MKFWVVFAPNGEQLGTVKHFPDKFNLQYRANNEKSIEYFDRLDEALLYLKGNWTRVSLEVA